MSEYINSEIAKKFNIDRNSMGFKLFYEPYVSEMEGKPFDYDEHFHKMVGGYQDAKSDSDTDTDTDTENTETITETEKKDVEKKEEVKEEKKDVEKKKHEKNVSLFEIIFDVKKEEIYNYEEHSRKEIFLVNEIEAVKRPTVFLNLITKIDGNSIEYIKISRSMRFYPVKRLQEDVSINNISVLNTGNTNYSVKLANLINQ